MTLRCAGLNLRRRKRKKCLLWGACFEHQDGTQASPNSVTSSSKTSEGKLFRRGPNRRPHSADVVYRHPSSSPASTSATLPIPVFLPAGGTDVCSQGSLSSVLLPVNVTGSVFQKYCHYRRSLYGLDYARFAPTSPPGSRTSAFNPRPASTARGNYRLRPASSLPVTAELPGESSPDKQLTRRGTRAAYTMTTSDYGPQTCLSPTENWDVLGQAVLRLIQSQPQSSTPVPASVVYRTPARTATVKRANSVPVSREASLVMRRSEIVPPLNLQQSSESKNSNESGIRRSKSIRTFFTHRTRSKSDDRVLDDGTEPKSPVMRSKSPFSWFFSIRSGAGRETGELPPSGSSGFRVRRKSRSRDKKKSMSCMVTPMEQSGSPGPMSTSMTDGPPKSPEKKQRFSGFFRTTSKPTRPAPVSVEKSCAEKPPVPAPQQYCAPNRHSCELLVSEETKAPAPDYTTNLASLVELLERREASLASLPESYPTDPLPTVPVSRVKLWLATGRERVKAKHRRQLDRYSADTLPTRPVSTSSSSTPPSDIPLQMQTSISSTSSAETDIVELPHITTKDRFRDKRKSDMPVASGCPLGIRSSALPHAHSTAAHLDRITHQFSQAMSLRRAYKLESGSVGSTADAGAPAPPEGPRQNAAANRTEHRLSSGHWSVSTASLKQHQHQQDQETATSSPLQLRPEHRSVSKDSALGLNANSCSSGTTEESEPCDYNRVSDSSTLNGVAPIDTSQLALNVAVDDEEVGTLKHHPEQSLVVNATFVSSSSISGSSETLSPTAELPELVLANLSHSNTGYTTTDAAGLPPPPPPRSDSLLRGRELMTSSELLLVDGCRYPSDQLATRPSTLERRLCTPATLNQRWNSLADDATPLPAVPCSPNGVWGMKSPLAGDGQDKTSTLTVPTNSPVSNYSSWCQQLPYKSTTLPPKLMDRLKQTGAVVSRPTTLFHSPQPEPPILTSSQDSTPCFASWPRSPKRTPTLTNGSLAEILRLYESQQQNQNGLAVSAQETPPIPPQRNSSLSKNSPVSECSFASESRGSTDLLERIVRVTASITPRSQLPGKASPRSESPQLGQYSRLYSLRNQPGQTASPSPSCGNLAMAARFNKSRQQLAQMKQRQGQRKSIPVDEAAVHCVLACIRNHVASSHHQ